MQHGFKKYENLPSQLLGITILQNQLNLKTNQLLYIKEETKQSFNLK